MTILLVRHDTCLPALDGMVAGEFAAARGTRFAALATGGAGHARFDCAQHVLAHGELAANGLLWAERAGDRPVVAPVDRGAVARIPGTVVVPINPHLAAYRDAEARILATAERAGRAVETLDVRGVDDRLELLTAGGEIVAAWRRDRFGRPLPLDATLPIHEGRALRVLIVGDEALQREVYPAPLAALGDAAEALGLDLTPVFADPRAEPALVWDRLLAGVDGLLLPGGSDMEQVEGQIAAARAAIRRDLPTAGLCLGMQTMASAVAQELCGMNDANLEEADPDAQTKTFVRLHDELGRPAHRLGLLASRLEPGSRLAALAGGAERLDVHYNHRFVLDPALEGPLAAAGLAVCARQGERAYADAIELPALRFFVGMQGHPELASRRGRPHPLLAGLLAAMASR
ncbi:glutamine amidotransferase-related protein [Ancylobacter mangrovi]|uniref:glutamine amidotransferase-related protein n=1 Tax=Ancylobacter mangrovi TaxID=2972472 RepID=UPI0021626917|nr:gamma-glutamyl-gamma-aminobutyrate hydrolase family protein [Ancylobacter mangrovi]MCS0502775.1 gamma-glutamyl-gamma-aminobutyrate hydrolase family protein [Ancylobacter mangrovi]